MGLFFQGVIAVLKLLALIVFGIWVLVALGDPNVNWYFPHAPEDIDYAYR